jgi:glycosyltransferase involved in cell wall biosynthesis
VSRELGAPRVAIAHDYLTQRGGAERVVLALTRAFPDAPVYTTLFDPANTFAEFSSVDVRTSALNRVSAFRRDHRLALPLLALAANSMRIDADVVIASSSGWSHGFRATGAKVVYCYSPARWLYQSDRYLGESSGRARRLALGALGPALRSWDRRAAKSADRYLAISTEVQSRIQSTYSLESTVVPAPHSMDPLGPQESLEQLGVPADAADFYLCLSRLLAYKNVDTTIEAIARDPRRRLIVVGSGPEEARLKRDLPANVTLVKHLSEAQLRWLYARCRAVVSASHEDFGLTPLEGAAFGKPSVVLRWGGFLDTILEGVTGEYFDDVTADSITAALDRFESRSWDAQVIRDRAHQYSEAAFAEAIAQVVADAAHPSARRAGAAR